MAKQTFKQFEDNSAALDIKSARDETMEKIKFQGQKEAFDLKIQELASKAAEFYEKYGEEDWRTSLLVNFLDLSLQMQDIIEVITAFNTANEIIFHAMNLMNASLQMSSGMMLNMNAPQTSPLKQRMMMRQAMRNNRKTVISMIEQMKMSIEMASMTAGMYEGLSTSISGILEKMNSKRSKKRTKKKADAASMSSASSRGLGMVKGILNDKGVATPAAAPSSFSAASSSSTGDSGLDGIL